MLKWYEWIYFLLCLAFCVYAFIDSEYTLGVVFTIITITATINSITYNIKNNKKKK